MAGINTKNWRRSAMLGVALAAIALPAAAMAQDAERGERHGGWHGNGGGGSEQRAQRQAAPAQQQSDGGQRQQRWTARPAPEAQAQVQTQASAGGGWRGRGGAQADVQAQAQAQAQAGGWRARGGDAGGNRWSHDRSNGSAVAQPAATAPERQARSSDWGQRNGTYSDPQRNSSYRDARTNDGSRYRQQQQSSNRDGYRSGSGDQWRRDGNRYSGSQQTWNRDWRRDNRYDWNSYRSRNRSIFNIGVYYSPYRNYSYRRLNIGFFLDSLFYSDRYWINDPWQYRLPEVYGPYRWVRYYDDALLVDIYSGEVVDTIYDFFY